MSPRTHWVCPNGCPAKLGSTRPRKDDVVRYCLACSAKSGKLVPRSAPALERQRAERSSSQAERRQLKLERERARTAAQFTVAGVDLREVLAKMWQLDWRERLNLPKAPPELIVKHHSFLRANWGLAWPWRHRIQVRVVTLNKPKDFVPAIPYHTMLHEVAHCLVDRTNSVRGGQRKRWHSASFQACLTSLEHEWYGREPLTKTEEKTE